MQADGKQDRVYTLRRSGEGRPGGVRAELAREAARRPVGWALQLPGREEGAIKLEGEAVVGDL